MPRIVSPGEQGVVNGVVGRRARQGLHVDVQLICRHRPGSKRLGAATAGQRLEDIGILDALIIAGIRIAPVVGQAGIVIQDFRLAHPAGILIRVPFGVQVLEHRAQRFSHRLGGAAFAGDQDQLAVLAFCFDLDQFIHIGVEIGNAAAK
jgi:hypothetical protein